jgi:hypothetical protein
MSNIEPGYRVGHWEVLSTDTNGKRITCRCSCGQIRVVAIDDLRSGACRCARPSWEHRAAFREAQVQQQRQRDLDWRRRR